MVKSSSHEQHLSVRCVCWFRVEVGPLLNHSLLAALSLSWRCLTRQAVLPHLGCGVAKMKVFVSSQQSLQLVVAEGLSLAWQQLPDEHKDKQHTQWQRFRV